MIESNREKQVLHQQSETLAIVQGLGSKLQGKTPLVSHTLAANNNEYNRGTMFPWGSPCCTHLQWLQGLGLHFSSHRLSPLLSTPKTEALNTPKSDSKSATLKKTCIQNGQ